MMQPGQRKVLPQPIQREGQRPQGGAGLEWADGATQTLFGQKAGSSTLFGAEPQGREAARSGPSLAVLAQDLFLIGLKIGEVKDLGPLSALKKLLVSYFREFERAAAAARKPPEWTDQARFALAAFLDETLTTTPNNLREEWTASPLQVEFFNDHLAGEHFFSRLEEMLRNAKSWTEPLEVYYLALALGFQGRYRLQGQEKLPVIVRNLLKRLEALKGLPPKAISPSANVHPGKKSEKGGGRLWLLLSGGFLALSLVFYLGLMAAADSPLEKAEHRLERAQAPQRSR